MDREDSSTDAISALQFGRDCEVAEMGLSIGCTTFPKDGFNSAATVRSRKSNASFPTNPNVTKASIRPRL